MSKKQFVLDALDNKPVDRVPVGFWFHFLPDHLWERSDENKRINVKGHQTYYDSFQPDFLKLMSDSFFTYPNPEISKVRTAADLRNIKAVNPTEWIDAQVELVKELTDRFPDIATFYNVFSPATYLKWQLQQASGEEPFVPSIFSEFVNEDPESVRIALDEIAKDIALLAEAVISRGGATGIYLSVQNIENTDQDSEGYAKTIAPAELTVLEAANRAGDYNILHICGYDGAKNRLTDFTGYPAKAINWAAVVEQVPLEEGKKIFGGRAVIGGFDNTKNGVLYKGTAEEIKAETKRLLTAAGTTGVILGADCTVPSDIDLSHLNWVREAAAEFGK